MAWGNRDARWEWQPGTARVEANLESAEPRWLLRARRGRSYWVDIAGGPKSTWAMAERLAEQLNNLDPSRWDYFIDHQLRALVSGEWG